MIKRGLILLVVVGAAIGVGTGFAATLGVSSHHLWAGNQALTKATCTLTGATSDTYVDENKKTQSFGTGASLITEPDAGKQKQVLVYFDLAGCSPALQSTWGADTATLSLRITTAPTASRTLTVTPLTSSFTSSTTWNGAPGIAAAATTTFTTGTTSNVTKSIPVTVDLDDWIKGNSTNYGWRIADLGGGTTAYQTTMSSSNAASNKPTLVINYEK